MEKDKYVAAEKLQEKIKKAEHDIYKIETLTTSCGLSGVITGSPGHRFCQMEYRLSYVKADTVIEVLNKERGLLMAELEGLKKQFNDL